MDATEFGTELDIQSAFRVADLKSFRAADGKYYAIVGHNPESRLITDKWIGVCDDVADFRTVLEYICTQFETGRYSYWLADLRFMSSSFSHSDAWLAEEVFPRVIRAGLVREAVVLPDNEHLPPDYDVFGAASSALQMITDDRVQGFQEIGLAKAWLFQDVIC